MSVCLYVCVCRHSVCVWVMSKYFVSVLLYTLTRLALLRFLLPCLPFKQVGGWHTCCISSMPAMSSWYRLVIALLCAM